MSRTLRMVLIALAGLALLLAALVAAVVTLVDPNDYRAPLESAVRERTGRALTIAGPMGLSFIPCCGVTVAEASLGNPPGFPAEPLVSVAEARAELRLWPLLTERRVEVGEIRLKGLRATLLARKDGSNNWSFPSRADQATDGDQAPGTTTPVRLAGIRIEEGALSYRDEANGSQYQVEQLNLETGPITPGEPIAVKASLAVTDMAARRSATINLDTRAMLGMGEAAALRLADTTAMVKLDTPELPGLPLTLDLKLAGADYAEGGFNLSGLSGTAEATPLKLSLEGNGRLRLGGKTALQGMLKLEPVSPRDLLAALKRPVPRTTDPKALTGLAGSANWALGKDSLSVEKLDLQLDQSRITGKLSRSLPAEGSTTPARTRFELVVDTLDLDRYLAPAAPSGGGDGAKAGAPAPTTLPLDQIRGLNVQGALRIGSLKVANVTLTRLAVDAAAADNRLKLDPLGAQLYGGSLSGRMVVDASGDTGKLELAQQFSNVELGKLLADYANLHNINGRMDLALNGGARGNTDEALVASLDGNVSLSLRDGVYRGVDVWHAIRSARALIRRQVPPPRPAEPATPIQRLELKGPVTDGVLKAPEAVVEIPYLRVTGPITVNAPARSLDARLEAVIYEEPQFNDGTDWSDFVNARLPLEIKGPLTGPKVGVDLKRMVRESVKQSLKDAILKKLGGTTEEAPESGTTEESKKPEDPLKKALDRLLR